MMGAKTGIQESGRINLNLRTDCNHRHSYNLQASNIDEGVCPTGEMIPQLN
jgi:hypothetical protein